MPTRAMSSPAAAEAAAAARDGALAVAIDALLPLEQAALAHDRVDAGSRGRVLPAIPD